MPNKGPRWAHRASGRLWYQQIDWGSVAYLLVAVILCAIAVLAVVIPYLHPELR